MAAAAPVAAPKSAPKTLDVVGIRTKASLVWSKLTKARAAAVKDSADWKQLRVAEEKAKAAFTAICDLPENV